MQTYKTVGCQPAGSMMASADLELGFRTPTQLNHFIVVPVMQTYKTVGCQPTGSMMASANL